MYQQLLNAKADVDAKTSVPSPKYEVVKGDYNNYLRLFPKLENMPLDVFLAKLDGDADISYKEKYKQYLNNQEEI